jgi:hypothetical protein
MQQIMQWMGTTSTNGFLCRLADSWFYADQPNRERIETTWEEDIEHYRATLIGHLTQIQLWEDKK